MTVIKPKHESYDIYLYYIIYNNMYFIYVILSVY